MAALRAVLVPLDGSPPSLAALDHALALVEDGEATLELLHVIEGHEARVHDPAAAVPAATREEMDRSVKAAFEQAEARVGTRVTRRTLVGDPLRTIIEAANEGDFDLIVMGTHGRVGRLHALLGSVAEGVVRNAPCPVLTVREPGGGYQSFAERRHGRPSVAERPPHHHS